MSDSIDWVYTVPGDDITRAGEASVDVKKRLKMMGAPPDVIRRASIALYEGEINMVVHADGGTITVSVSDDCIRMVLKDTGPGIPDIAKAMTAGFSTAPDNIRSLGFGAGMGLPKKKKNTDYIDVQSTVGVGTTVTMRIDFH